MNYENIVDLNNIILNWNLYKDKDLTDYLNSDEMAKNYFITNHMLKDFMSKYSFLKDLIIKNTDIYKFISEISKTEDKDSYIKEFTDRLLRKKTILTDEEYKKIFKYSSLEEHLKSFNEPKVYNLIKELRTLDKDYIFNINIPITVLLNADVLTFVGTYGLKTIVDFDNECGHFFTKDDFKELKSFNNIFLNFDSCQKDKTLNLRDENGDFILRPYRKEEFYEVMRRAITYGPNYLKKAVDYRDITGEFRNKYKDLFLPEEIDEEIKNKFYKKEFTLKDFSDNYHLFDVFKNTNIVCGFPKTMSWIIPLYNDEKNIYLANYKRMKILYAYSKIEDFEIQREFKEYVSKNISSLDIEKIDCVAETLSRLSFSNSTEITKFKKELATQLLNSKDPLRYLEKIEDIFIKNNIPIVGKIYSCFEILHPDFLGFDFFNKNSTISPVLKKASLKAKRLIVFSDLIKASLGSNNRSIKEYLKNIEFGSKMYEKIKNNELDFSSLSEKDKNELLLFSKHLITLYNNTTKAKINKDSFKRGEDVVKDILEIAKKISPNESLDYNLGDRLIRMFCGSIGVNTLEEPKKYIEEKIKYADRRNRELAKNDFVLEYGDFVKGIGDIKYINNILQNGSISKEFLGDDASIDSTPLDTDISKILTKDGKLHHKINLSSAGSYGPIWLILKNDDRFITTRDNDKEKIDFTKDLSKLELFYTGVISEDHYGIRTGFASSDINLFVMEKYDPRLGLEIAMNGFYIPVVNKDGKVIFSPKDYDDLRKKMSGLSFYEENNYNFSNNLKNEEINSYLEKIEENIRETKIKKEKVTSLFKKVIEELGLGFKTNIDKDLSEGIVELIDTGSTGRETNKIGNSDFDFMMRLDKSIVSSPKKIEAIKRAILKKINKDYADDLTNYGDFRFYGVKIDEETVVDIDVTFAEKTDKLVYTTDMALKDRLQNIKTIDEEKYKYVIANILLAKEVLSKAKVYKSKRGRYAEGGLGGAGVENWILQNGGSFIDAAKSFVEAADGKRFSEFQLTYPIWDFGENHLSDRKSKYPHDNYVADNMDAMGYSNMLEVLKTYLYNLENKEELCKKVKK